MNIKRFLYGLAGLALLIGAWGLYDRFVFGHANTNYGSYVVWGLWVAMYLFFAGVAAGSFMISTLDFLFRIPIFKGTGRIALWTALVSLAAGLTSIGLDLGHMERIWKVFLEGNPSSVMFQMVWGYTLFGLLMLICLFLAIRMPESRLLRVLMGIGLVLSLFVSGAVGALLGVQAARPFWHVGLFPVQFPVFSLASGTAVMLSVLAFFGPKGDPNRRQQFWVLGILSVALVLVKLYFIWADYSVSIYGNVPQNVNAVREVLFGPYWWAFWILQLLIGSLIPVVVLSQKKLVQRPMLIGWMGVCLLIGYAVARGLIIFPALTIPEIENLANAFGGPHLTFEYFPSLVEWAVTIGTIGMATMGVLVGGDFLPLYLQSHKKGKV
ncbi:MAG: NrfD/PsrC family molybdoenzyme membrane anchor subunit [Anaerolineales bacterium]